MEPERMDSILIVTLAHCVLLLSSSTTQVAMLSSRGCTALVFVCALAALLLMVDARATAPVDRAQTLQQTHAHAAVDATKHSVDLTPHKQLPSFANLGKLYVSGVSSGGQNNNSTQAWRQAETQEARNSCSQRCDEGMRREAMAACSDADPLPAPARSPALTFFPCLFVSSLLCHAGYMAGQLHVAYSGSFSGVGIFAAGPYGCANGDLEKALAACTDDSADLGLAELEGLTADASALGTIDPVSNLINAPVWIFHGQSDATVKRSVVDAAVAFYEHYGANVMYNNLSDANHAWVAPLGANPCTVSASPYTSNCPSIADPQFEMLSHLYGRAPAAPVSNLSGSLTAFSQDTYTIGKWGLDAALMSMDSTGFIYVPPQCSSGAVTCDIMLLLHGCEQSASIVGQDLIEQSGMNQYADSNNFIVLYPQTIALEEGVVLNPKACWDWWGYLGDDELYAVHGGYQIEVLMAMVNALKKAD